jgi:Ca2+-binding RTX toxin-like protein
MATQFVVGTEGDDWLSGGPGENDFTGGAGNDLIDAAQGVNTIHFNPGDGVDTVNFNVPRAFQYADFLQAAMDGLNELNGFQGSSYSNEYFSTADRTLFRDLPADIAAVLTELHNSRTGEGSADPADAEAAFSSLVQWINEPSSNVIQFGPGISLSDISVQMGATTSFNSPFEFSVSVKGQGGMLFEYAGTDNAANSSSTPPSLPISFQFANGTTVSLDSLLATNQVGSIGTQFGTDGDDTLVGSLSGDSIYGLGGNDTISGGAGSDSLDGGAGNDTIDGGAGADYVYGGDGDDVLAAGRDGGVMSGGAGNDVYLFNSGDGVVSIFNQGAEGDVDTISFGGIDPALVVASVNPGNGLLTLQVAGSNDQISIQWFDPSNDMAENADQVVSRIQFIDAQGHAQVFDLAAIVHDMFSEPASADPSATVQLFADSTHELIGEPPAGGNLAVRYAMDGEMPAQGNLTPVSSQIGEHTVQEDDASFELKVSDAFVDPEGRQLSFAATMADGSALPSWLNFDGTTGTFSGTPSNDDVGRLSLQVKATDPGGLSVAQTFNLVVENTNDAPTATAGAVDATATQDQAFSMTLAADTFADVDAGDSLTYTATLADGSALPSWLQFDASTMTLSGTPANGDVGNLAVNIIATDGSNASAMKSVNLSVANVNDAPVLAQHMGGQSATEDAPFSFVVPANTFADIDMGDSITLSATQEDGSGLPSWLNFDAASGTFSGTPANGDVGSLSIRVTAKDAAGATVSDVFNIGVANTNDAPVVANAIADQTATEDAAFSYVLPANTFADVDLGDSMTLSATQEDGSALPSWLNFDAASGTFSGTPANGDVGSLSIKVTAKYGAGATVSDVFNIGVANTNDAPTVAQPVADQTATAGTPFSMVVPGTTFSDVDAGDALTYSARLQNGDPLPAWLSFDAATRTLRGTAAGAGTWDIQITATDLSGASVADVFAVTVNQASNTGGQTMRGGNGNDVLSGGNGNDTMTGGLGNDMLSGGGGNDTLSFSKDSSWKRTTRTNAGSPGESGSRNKVDLNGKSRSYDVYDGGAGYDKLVGTSDDDAILLDDSSSPAAASGPRLRGIERIEAGAGDDLVDLTSKRYAYGDVTIDGGAGNDVLWSSSGNDVLLGGAGNDKMKGGAGND